MVALEAASVQKDIKKFARILTNLSTLKLARVFDMRLKSQIGFCQIDTKLYDALEL